MRLPIALLAVFAAACASQPGALSEAALARQGLEGPYVAEVEETFALDVGADVRVTWSASGGALAGQNERVTWTLPEGLATLSAELVRGEERVTREWHFHVEPAPREGVLTAREALLAAPIAVIDGGVEQSGRACDLATDSSGAVHLAFTTSTHPSIFYGRWSGSAWTIEFVDGLGLNVGGLVSDTAVRLAVESNGTPHLLYQRSNGLTWASKSGTTWLRERVDTDALANQGTGFALTLNPNASSRPTVVYTSYNASFYERLTVAQRTAANTWGPQQASVVGATWEVPRGEAVYLGANLYVPFAASTSAQRGIARWTGSAWSNLPVPQHDLNFASLVTAGANRLLLRTTTGVVDVAVNATTFASSTFTFSPSIVSASTLGDLGWNGSRPVVMQLLGGSLELATPSNDGYWQWTALAQANSSGGAALALHPTSGVANICYQANGRVMFQ